MDRFTDEARARMLAEIQLLAAGFDPWEIADTIRDYPEEFGPEKMLRPRSVTRRVTRRDLDEGGPI